MSWSVHAGSGMSLIWRWQHSRLPGRLAAGYWQVHAVCMLGSIGTRQTAGCTVLMVVLWMPAKSFTDVARVGGSWSFPQNMHQPKSWLLAQAVVTRGSLPAFIRGPWANKRCDVLAGGGGGGDHNAGEGELCFHLFYRPGQKWRPQLQLPLFVMLGNLPNLLSLYYPTCNASLPVRGELGRSRALQAVVLFCLCALTKERELEAGKEIMKASDCSR